ncbi:hypothetical protein PG987_016066 [Apiospora arundinis]
MQKRRTHHKSRTGCYSCKQKHVKCDEQGPPCTNCVLRETQCIYPTPEELEEARLKKKAASSLIRPGSKDPRTFRKERLPGFFPDIAPAAPKLVSNPSPPHLSGEPLYDRRLELELMHQWTTKTWMGFYEIPEDQRYLQEELPRTALKESYLLNGILAIAATDLAHQTGASVSSKYIQTALVYSNQASIQFRHELSRLAATNNSHVLYASGIIVERGKSTKNEESISEAANNRGIGQQLHTTTMPSQRVNAFFDLLISVYNNLLTNIKWTINESSGIRAAVDQLLKEPLTLDLVSFDTRLAMERLTSVSQYLETNSPSHSNGDTVAASPLVDLCSKVSVYRLAISQTKLSFVVEALNLPQGLCMSFITSTGLDFLNLVKAMDSMALFILMHIGVLFCRLSKRRDTLGLAIGNTALNLINELSGMLEATPIYQTPDGRDGILWCQQQVGLQPTTDAGTLVRPDMMFDNQLKCAFG